MNIWYDTTARSHRPVPYPYRTVYRLLNAHYTCVLDSRRFLAMDRSISYALEKIACSTVVLKAEQATCIKCIYEGKDVFLWLPTGFGKSLCYEVLPFVFDDKLGKDNSVVIVVSPLISLMVDQVQSLRRRSVRPAIMSSGSKVDKEFLATDDDIRDGRLFFFFLGI